LVRRRKIQKIIKIIKTILWALINRPRRSKDPEETLLYWRKIVEQTKNYPEIKK
jgi:hypothetical protein